MTYSIIVAVYNRPSELEDLLESLTTQTFTDFEVVVVEDGSSITSQNVCASYSKHLNVSYFTKPNSGPGPSRNYGCRRASADVFIFLDSDCMVPPEYLASVDNARKLHGYDAFGGPDRDHPSFTTVQKAISFAMTSILTTGGIRGSKRRVTGTFHPRSFNMGITREVFNATDGFSTMRFGEDIDLSIRILNLGFIVGLIPEAWVFHKRRTDLKKFFKQVYNSGSARISLSIKHPSTLKIAHLFPASFTLYLSLAIIYSLALPMGIYLLIPIAGYAATLFFSALVQSKSVTVGLMSVLASIVQLVGYGSGFLSGVFWKVMLNRRDHNGFSRTFYK
ncbi:MAG: glycosyltransferase [Ignavibacteria bacterium]|jgi:glycosyltransferase involved in cell wall biosynthesis|nr:glycosyltransferase [Ignavibacteria bacterium]